MIRYERRYWVLAASLAALAGYVDAIGFLQLGGFFVSFMSGNSTRLAVGIAWNAAAASLAGALLVAFVLGVILGAVAAAWAGPHHRKPRVLMLVTLLLAVGALMEQTWGGLWPALAMANAMGAVNSVFQRNGEVTVGVTYMTGTLVKLGQHIASALMGGKRWNWLPYLFLWGALVGGATLGAVAYAQLGPTAVWAAVIFAAALAVYAAALGPTEPQA